MYDKDGNFIPLPDKVDIYDASTNLVISSFTMSVLRKQGKVIIPLSGKIYIY